MAWKYTPVKKKYKEKHGNLSVFPCFSFLHGDRGCGTVTKIKKKAFPFLDIVLG